MISDIDCRDLGIAPGPLFGLIRPFRTYLGSGIDDLKDEVATILRSDDLWATMLQLRVCTIDDINE